MLGRAAIPIAMTVFLIVVTISLALFIGPFYNALGMTAGMEDYADNPLYAFLFLGMVIVMALVILLLRKVLKRRRLKLKYLLALAVLLSTTTVLTPFMDMAANGAPEIWKEYHFDVVGANRALPLDPLDLDEGLLVLTDSSFHALKRGKGEYTEISSVKGLTMVYDPSYNAGIWTILGVKDGKATVWSITTDGGIEQEWEPVHQNSAFALVGTSTANVEGNPYIMSFWNGTGSNYDIILKNIGPDGKVSRLNLSNGPFLPVTGISNDRTFFRTNSSFHLTVLRERNGTIMDWGGSAIGGPSLNITWSKADGDVVLAWSDTPIWMDPPNPPSRENLDMAFHLFNSPSDIKSGLYSITDVPYVSPYLVTVVHEVTFENDRGPIQALYVDGRTLFVRTGSQVGPYDETSYLLSETPIGLFATEIDGTVIIVDDDTISMGRLSSEERLQWWVQGSAFLLALGMVILIMKKPKWWLIDLAGILMGAGVVALMGISFPLLFTLLLLVLLAGYDAVAVYKTKHMIALADSVVEAKMPILLVFPMKMNYRYEDETNLMDPKRKRRSLFMGLGDVIIPGILIVSAFSFLPNYGGTWIFGLIPPNLGVALFTLAGMLMGYAVLIGFVLKGKAHAGLPPLNGGSILMFLLGHLLIYGTFVFW